MLASSRCTSTPTGDPIQGVDPTGLVLVGAIAGIGISTELRSTNTKATLAAYAVAGAAIDGVLFEVTRSILWAISLSASPTRSLT